MFRLVLLAAIAVVVWRFVTGRWPWQAGPAALERRAKSKAREILGVGAGATRQDIIEAHKKRVATVHPDRGGRNEDVHQANAARDILLGDPATNTREHP